MTNFVPAIMAGLFTVVAAIAAFLVTSPNSKMTAILVIVILGVGFVLVTTAQQNAKDANQRTHFDEMNRQLVDLRRLVSQQVPVSQVGTPTVTVGPPAAPATLMNNVFPFLRFAYILQNYDGATRDRVENENRILLPSSPPVRLNYERYVREFEAGDSWFNFGVANLNGQASVDDVTLMVTFKDDVTVKAGGHWESLRENQQYRIGFATINAGHGYNGDGVLRVHFPRRGTYTIELAITARNLPVKTRNLQVILE